MDPIYFQVPFADKTKAKGLGGRWDATHRHWFAADPLTASRLGKYWKVVNQIEPISELPGEDRSFGGNDLFIDLIPASCWFVNVRYCIEPEDWNRLSLGIQQRAGFKCEICGATQNKEVGLFLEAHERWHFDEATGTQVLKRIICLCSLCHRTTHYGYAQVVGEEAKVRNHFMSVNQVSAPELDAHVREAFEIWNQRKDHLWKLDLSIITNAGIRLKSKPKGKPSFKEEDQTQEGLTIEEVVDVEDFISRAY